MKDRIIKWIKDWFELNGPESPAVIGISGGVDSSVVAALCVEALGKDRVIGLLLPDGTQHDISDSFDLIEHLGIRHTIISIEKSMKEMENIFDKWDHVNQLNQFGNVPEWRMKASMGNSAARIRMTTLYGVSQLINGRVSNNCNLSERFVGYSTIYGDAAGDFSPLSDLTKTEVVRLARELGLPIHLVIKVPIDGLNMNFVDGKFKTDEESMGFSYIDLDKYIIDGTCGKEDVDLKIARMHLNSEFKRLPRIAYFKK